MNFLLYSSIRPSTRCSSLDGAQRGGHQRLRLAALEEGRAVRPRQHADLAGDAAGSAWGRGRRCACLPGSGRGRRALPGRRRRPTPAPACTWPSPCLRGRYSATMLLAQLARCCRRGRACRRSACARGTRRSTSAELLDERVDRRRRRRPASGARPALWRSSSIMSMIVDDVLVARTGSPASISSSGISRAKPSIMVMACACRTRSGRGRSLPAGCASASAPTRRRCGRRGRVPVGCRNGMCETCRAALAPIMRQHVGVVLPVGGQGAGHDLHFVEVAGGEERADGPVDQAAR